MNNLRKLIRKEVRSVMDGKRVAIKDNDIKNFDAKGVCSKIYSFYSRSSSYADSINRANSKYRKYYFKISKIGSDYDNKALSETKTSEVKTFHKKSNESGELELKARKYEDELRSIERKISALRRRFL